MKCWSSSEPSYLGMLLLRWPIIVYICCMAVLIWTNLGVVAQFAWLILVGMFTLGQTAQLTCIESVSRLCRSVSWLCESTHLNCYNDWKLEMQWNLSFILGSGFYMWSLRMSCVWPLCTSLYKYLDISMKPVDIIRLSLLILYAYPWC